MEVIVPDDQLSLAIGRRGQNVRLASDLSKWYIDVVSETEEASLKRKSTVIPGKVYKLVRPFLGMSLSTSIWKCSWI